MEQPLIPENELTNELQKQERALHHTLAALHKLAHLAADETLSKKALIGRAKPFLDQLRRLNSAVAKEIETLFHRGNRIEIEHYFAKEKQELTETLSDELKHRQQLIAKINKNK